MYIMLIIINCLLLYILCIDIDECLSGPCPSHMICNNNDGSYSCDCPDGTIKDELACNGNNYKNIANKLLHILLFIVSSTTISPPPVPSSTSSTSPSIILSSNPSTITISVPSTSPTASPTVAQSTSNIELSGGTLAGIIIAVIVGVIAIYTGVMVVAIRFVAYT